MTMHWRRPDICVSSNLRQKSGLGALTIGRYAVLVYALCWITHALWGRQRFAFDMIEVFKRGLCLDAHGGFLLQCVQVNMAHLPGVGEVKIPDTYGLPLVGPVIFKAMIIIELPLAWGRVYNNSIVLHLTPLNDSLVMTTLTAAQFIYTRVEAQYSPQRRDGFQTVYRSATLSQSDINAIEHRVQCFQPPLATVVRRQYFMLSSGKIVVTRTQQIAAHPEIIDRTRRAGAFLAHALVIEAADFATVEYNPFVLFDCVPWIQSAEEMVERFGQAIGVAPPVALPVDGPVPVPACAWSGREAYHMLILALQAETWVQAQQMVPFIGSAENIDEALRTVLYLAPPHKRLACTFDTCIDGCPPPRGLTWAVGTATRPQGEVRALVATNERRVVSQGEASRIEPDLYLAWLHQASIQEAWPEVLRHTGAIQRLTAAFARREPPVLEAEHTDAYTTFCSLHSAYLLRRIEDALAPTVGDGLAPLLAEYIMRSKTEDVPPLSLAATQRLPVKAVSRLTLEWLMTHTPFMHRDDWYGLQQLARRGDHPRLLHLAATMGDKVDVEARDEALSAMDTATFEQVLAQCPVSVAPADLVTPDHVTLLLAWPRVQRMSVAQSLDLIAALLRVKAMGSLPILITYVSRMDHKQLASLEKMLAKRPGVPSEFRTAVSRQRQVLGQAPGWFRLFRK